MAKTRWTKQGDRWYTCKFGPVDATMIAVKDSEFYVKGFWCYLSIGTVDFNVYLDEIGNDPLADNLDSKAQAAMSRKIKAHIREWAK